MERKRVLITVNHFRLLDKRFLERLESAGLEPFLMRQEDLLSEAAMIAVIPGVFATIAGSEPYSELVLAAADRLRAIARFGVGYDRVDVNAATARGVVVTVTFGTNHDAVADRAFAFMGALSNKLLEETLSVKAGEWDQGNLHATLFRATVGIVGLGRIGQALARRCRGFEMRVLAFETSPDLDFARKNDVELVPLDQLLRESDFVSLHTPVTPHTDGFINRERLALMKPSAYLINTARGRLVDEDELADALKQRRIAGAGLEVFRREPPIGSPLLSLENVLLAPHSATQTRESVEMTANVCIDCVLAATRNESPPIEYVLNPDVLRAEPWAARA